jgi:trans-2,3-dihydro-3-hydroxyanthranilate isomerase
MPSYDYHLLDVFTDQPFAGNQLAVFSDARGMSAELMQKITRELNLSECTFVLPPEDAANHFRVRIFTPGRELPVAGHPTIGTGYALAEIGKIAAVEGSTIVRFEEGVGVIPVEIHFAAGKPDLVTMDQPVPTFGDTITDWAGVAAMLSINESDLDTRYPIQVMSSGVPFLFIPVRDRDAMARLRLRADIYERDYKDVALGLFMVSADTERPGAATHCRMFAPEVGVAEDPATGVAHGPLGAYALKYGIISGEQVTFISEQGIEMGRPSLITVTVEAPGGVINRVRVGGSSRMIGEGKIHAG